MHLKTKALALLTLLSFACGTAQGVEDPSPAVRDAILIPAASGVQAVSAGTGQIAKTISDAVLATDSGSVVSTHGDGQSTAITRTTAAGDVLEEAVVEGDVVARIATRDLVALTGRTGAGETAYLPAPKRETRIVVLDAQGNEREFLLDGNFEPEAFSVDGSELFLIEYIPALDPQSYQVRRLKLKNGSVLPIGRLKGNAPDQMQGTGRAQVMAPTGDELYTLYTQQIDPGHALSTHETHEDDTGHAFVHLLNLRDKWAHCIDLPPVFASGKASASALAANASGNRVYVADWNQGAIAAVNPRRVTVVDTADVDLGPADDSTFAVADQESLFIAGNNEVVVLDQESLEILTRWTYDDEITGLSLKEGRLFVSLDDEVLVREL